MNRKRLRIWPRKKWTTKKKLKQRQPRLRQILPPKKLKLKKQIRNQRRIKKLKRLKRLKRLRRSKRPRLNQKLLMSSSKRHKKIRKLLKRKLRRRKLRRLKKRLLRKPILKQRLKLISRP